MSSRIVWATQPIPGHDTEVGAKSIWTVQCPSLLCQASHTVCPNFFLIWATTTGKTQRFSPGGSHSLSEQSRDNSSNTWEIQCSPNCIYTLARASTVLGFARQSKYGLLLDPTSVQTHDGPKWRRRARFQLEPQPGVAASCSPTWRLVTSLAELLGITRVQSPSIPSLRWALTGPCDGMSH